MRPTPFQWLFGSRYTLPLWLGLGLWFWFSQGGDWDRLTQDQQISIAIVGGLFGFAFLQSFPTVFFYEREQSMYRKSSMSPEQRWQRQTVYQLFFLVLIAAALIYAGVHYWKSPASEPQPASYKAAAGVGGVSLLAGAAYVTIKPYFVKKQDIAHTLYVFCPLPIPKHTKAPLELPDYCLRVLAASDKRSPAQAPAVHPEVTT